MKIDLKWRGAGRFAKANISDLTVHQGWLPHLEKAYENGTLKTDAPIVEATSGNTGISFSAIGRLMGHPVTIFMPDWMSAERKSLMASYGATIRLVSVEEGGFLGSIALAEQMQKDDPNVFLPRQFDNEDNSESHYLTTGPEIIAQLAKIQRGPRRVYCRGWHRGRSWVRPIHQNSSFTPRFIRSNSSEFADPTTGYKIGFHRFRGSPTNLFRASSIWTGSTLGCGSRRRR